MCTGDMIAELSPAKRVGFAKLGNSLWEGVERPRHTPRLQQVLSFNKYSLRIPAVTFRDSLLKEIGTILFLGNLLF